MKTALMLLMAIWSTQFSAAFAQDTCKTRVQAALDRLLARQNQRGPYVVIEDVPTRKFVQFAIDKKGILVDLPTMALSEPERKRAALLFSRAGIRKPNVVEGMNPESKKTFTFASYQLGFGTETARAGLFACRALQDVFLLAPTSPVNVIEAHDDF